MTRVRNTFVLLLLLPTIAAAQKKAMGGSKETDWNAVAEKKAPAGPTISAKDFENASPFKLFLDKKKDLKLTDAQLVSFKDLDVKLKEANRERFTLLDSLKRDARPRTSGNAAAEDEVRMVLARDALMGVARDIRMSFDAAAKDALPTLDASQQASAQEVMQKYEKDMRDMMREKLGVNAGDGGPAAAKRGRPPVSA